MLILLIIWLYFAIIYAALAWPDPVFVAVRLAVGGTIPALLILIRLYGPHIDSQRSAERARQQHLKTQLQTDGNKDSVQTAVGEVDNQNTKND